MKKRCSDDDPVADYLRYTEKIVAYYMANKPEWMKRHKREREWLIKKEKENKQKENCLQCPMFYWIKGDDGKYVCGGCTGDMRIRIKNRDTVHSKCPCRRGTYGQDNI